MKVKIEFVIELPDVAHTREELEEYLRFYFRDNGSMNTLNPIDVAMNREPEPIFGTFEWDYLTNKP